MDVEVEASPVTVPANVVTPDEAVTLPEEKSIDEEQAQDVIPPTSPVTSDEPYVVNSADIEIISEPESITALVNKKYALPDDYEPSELIYPDINFIFSEKLDKRKLRKEAADAIAQLFAGAAEDDITLLGVSAYRSNATQKALFERYVKRDGIEQANTYSAVPGHSEHETGLAIDVTGGDGKCAAMSCFGDSKEATWLAEHAAEYGFVVRYPEGKQQITGYMYEPWHIRYVGITVAQEVAAQNLTLEEYFNTAIVLR